MNTNTLVVRVKAKRIIAPEMKDKFIGMMGDVPLSLLGEFTEEMRFEVRDKHRGVYINESVVELKEAWQSPLRW